MGFGVEVFDDFYERVRVVIVVECNVVVCLGELLCLSLVDGIGVDDFDFYDG